jgi:hypothetical protein
MPAHRFVGGVVYCSACATVTLGLLGYDTLTSPNKAQVTEAAAVVVWAQAVHVIVGVCSCCPPLQRPSCGVATCALLVGLPAAHVLGNGSGTRRSWGVCFGEEVLSASRLGTGSRWGETGEGAPGEGGG